jgi:penicillin amidase
VRCTGSDPGLTDEVYRGSVARYVWDLADRQAGGWVVPMGADGDPRAAHHHDQLEAWAAGELVPIVTDWERLTEETR